MEDCGIKFIFVPKEEVEEKKGVSRKQMERKWHNRGNTGTPSIRTLGFKHHSCAQSFK